MQLRAVAKDHRDESETRSATKAKGEPRGRKAKSQQLQSKLSSMLSGLGGGAATPPSEPEEAARDLCRARSAGVQDRTTARHRLSKFLLRRGLRWERTPWTQVHRKWLRALSFEEESAQLAFDNYLLALEQVEGRVKDLQAHLEKLADTDRIQ